MTRGQRAQILRRAQHRYAAHVPPDLRRILRQQPNRGDRVPVRGAELSEQARRHLAGAQHERASGLAAVPGEATHLAHTAHRRPSATVREQ